MNKLLLYSLFLLFLAQVLGVTKKESISVFHNLGTQLSKNNEEFQGLKDSEYFRIHDVDVHHILHALNHDTSNLQSKEGGEHLQHHDLSHADHMLKSQAHFNKNNARKAVVGFWLSKFAVHACAQVVYALAAGVTALVYAPAAPVVYCSLQLTFASLVEIASNFVACGMTVVGDSV